MVCHLQSPLRLVNFIYLGDLVKKISFLLLGLFLFKNAFGASLTATDENGYNYTVTGGIVKKSKGRLLISTLTLPKGFVATGIVARRCVGKKDQLGNCLETPKGFVAIAGYASTLLPVDEKKVKVLNKPEMELALNSNDCWKHTFRFEEKGELTGVAASRVKCEVVMPVLFLVNAFFDGDMKVRYETFYSSISGNNIDIHPGDIAINPMNGDLYLWFRGALSSFSVINKEQGSCRDGYVPIMTLLRKPTSQCISEEKSIENYSQVTRITRTGDGLHALDLYDAGIVWDQNDETGQQGQYLQSIEYSSAYKDGELRLHTASSDEHCDWANTYFVRYNLIGSIKVATDSNVCHE